MEEYEGRGSPKGQITIPAKLGARLGLTPGVKVRFMLERDGIKIQPAESRLSEGLGAVKPHNCPEDWTAVRREFEELAAEDARTRGQQ